MVNTDERETHKLEKRLCRQVGEAIVRFNMIEEGVRYGLPEKESWRMAFGLTATLVWLYVEILRFLAIFASNRD